MTGREQLANWEDESSLRVFEKSLREQPTAFHVGALLQAVRGVAEHHRYRDGFVDWTNVSSFLDAAEGSIERHERGTL
jgi:hypothetical protein